MLSIVMVKLVMLSVVVYNNDLSLMPLNKIRDNLQRSINMAPRHSEQ
jgi:hypothetical protein